MPKSSGLYGRLRLDVVSRTIPGLVSSPQPKAEGPMKLSPATKITYLSSILAGMLAACGGDDTSGQDGPGTMTAADTGSCPDNGLAGCPCIEGGLCVAGAVCIDGICEAEQGATGPEGDTEKDPVQTTGADSTGGGAMGSCEGQCGNVPEEGCACDPVCTQFGDCCDDFEMACPGACIANDDCAASEVCSASSFSCVPAYGHTYGVVVESWTDYSDVCWDFDSCYDADPFYRIVNCGETVFTSSTIDNTSFASWTTEAEVQVVDDCAFSITMRDEDISEHDFILTWCMTNESGQCWILPEDILHDGFWSGTWEGAGTGGYGLEIRFRPL